MTASELLTEIEDVGKDRRRGGYSRHVFDAGETELRQWFVEQAHRRGLDVEHDRNGNIWAWWGERGSNALVTGSHLDSVPGGGAFDGPLGVASALVAFDILRGRGIRPSRPLAIVVFGEEEGGRFGVACLGSRLMTGAIDPASALCLTDVDGTTYADAARHCGHEPSRFGRDLAMLGRIGQFIELHVEQGRGLVDKAAPIAVASAIDAHGRWRFSFTGQGNHAGTTALSDRSDPMLPAASVITQVRRSAAARRAKATVGRILPTPGGTNVIASQVDLWLDARVPGDDNGRTRDLVEDITGTARDAAAEEGCSIAVTEESYSDKVTFDQSLARNLIGILGDCPVLETGAGHDAGILAAHVPTGMLFVRNPTGISHAPEEFVEDADIGHGAQALADVLETLS